MIITRLVMFKFLTGASATDVDPTLITVWFNHGLEEARATGVSRTPDVGVARKVE